MTEQSTHTQLQTVNVHRAAGAATVELNRPEKLNAWNHQFGEDLLAAVNELSADEDVRAVVITGAGRGFSSGADLTDISGGWTTEDGRPDVYRTLTERYHPIMHGIRHMPKPVIASVNGPAVGIGCSLALCCDLILAAESAYFLLAFVNIGLVPDGGSSLLLPTRVGMARAAELSMLGERLPAPKALEWGLINRVVEDELLAGETAELAERLAAGPTRSYAGSKRQLNNWLYARMDEQRMADLVAQHPVGRLGTADEVAALVSWLAGPDAGFVTGAAYTVDGGFTS